MFDTPNDFALDIESDGVIVRYHDVMEICQGGPQIGNISINNNNISGKFGGPLILSGNLIYLPMLCKKWWGGKRFKLAKIDVSTLNISLIETALPLIFLHKIEENNIFYYTDMEATERYSFDLNQFTK